MTLSRDNDILPLTSTIVFMELFIFEFLLVVLLSKIGSAKLCQPTCCQNRNLTNKLSASLDSK